METRCVVLDIAHSSSGEAVILDFPPGVTPFLKMELQDSNGNTWTVKGMGLPVILAVLEKKIDTYYDSEMVWDCLLQTTDLELVLEKGAKLSI